jgi:hypothetical protein
LDSDSLKNILEQLAHGARSVESVLDLVTSEINDVAETSDACVDLDRRRRCGFPEVVYGAGKTPESIVAIFHELRAAGQHCLVTRVSSEQAATVQAAFQHAIYNPIARTVRLAVDNPAELRGRVAVVSAGTSDRPVAEEALETLRWMNCGAELIQDVGVAGPQRLLRQLDRLQRADVCVVVAGMEGALASVVAGHLSCPIFAVPTSVGYGANLGGLAALLSMLNSCAANVAVVNIDAGFRAGYLAGMIALRIAEASQNPTR